MQGWLPRGVVYTLRSVLRFREIIYILLIYRIVGFRYFYLSNKTVTQTSFLLSCL